jgi:hypothetical protein
MAALAERGRRKAPHFPSVDTAQRQYGDTCIFTYMGR